MSDLTMTHIAVGDGCSECQSPHDDALRDHMFDMYTLLRATVNILRSRDGGRRACEELLAAVIEATLSAIKKETESIDLAEAKARDEWRNKYREKPESAQEAPTAPKSLHPAP